jgi:hypothetical protein
MERLEKPFTWIKNNFFNLLTAIIILFCVIGRLSFYGDPRLSIATNDSSSYYNAVGIPLFSREAFTARRLPSYPTFFKLFLPSDGYPKPIATSYPAAPEVGTSHKALQSGFDNVVVAQMILSIFAWIVFVIVLSKRIKTKALRPIVALVVLFFAFTPPLAEWDSILMSESISFSFFTLLSAVTLELIFRILEERTQPRIITTILLGIWILLIPAWAFTRDSNVNTISILIMFLVILLVIPKLRKQIPFFVICGITVLLVALMAFYSLTTLSANRWVGAWNDIWNHWMTGYPAREKFFVDHGMPDPWTAEWVKAAGPSTYLLFLFEHPGFMVTELLGRLSDAFSENIQPFFFTYPTLNRKMLLAVGDLFHPLSSISFIFPIFGGVLVVISVLKNFIKNNIAWLLFVLWLIGMIYGLYLASFFGDSGGLIRHTLGAVVYMRMMIWLLPIIIAEIVTQKKVLG